MNVYRCPMRYVRLRLDASIDDVPRFDSGPAAAVGGRTVVRCAATLCACLTVIATGRPARRSESPTGSTPVHALGEMYAVPEVPSTSHARTGGELMLPSTGTS